MRILYGEDLRTCFEIYSDAKALSLAGVTGGGNLTGRLSQTWRDFQVPLKGEPDDTE